MAVVEVYCSCNRGEERGPLLFRYTGYCLCQRRTNACTISLHLYSTSNVSTNDALYITKRGAYLLVRN